MASTSASTSTSREQPRDEEIAPRHSTAATREMLHPSGAMTITLGTSSREGEEFWGDSTYGEFMVNTSRETWALAPSLFGLKIIVISGPNSNQAIHKVSGKPFWLRWFRIGQRNLPSEISLTNLRVLELNEEVYGDHHLEELWMRDGDAPMQLRELLIFTCTKFQRFPKSIGCLKDLKKIVVAGDWNRLNKVESLPEEFCLLQSLEHLELRCCNLSSLPTNFGDLRTLQYLHLSGHGKLSTLPVSFKALTLLRHLCINGFYNLVLQSDILEDFTKLKFFSLSSSRKLEELPRDITNLYSLTELLLDDAKRLRDVPPNIGQLSKLRKLCISKCDFLRSLPTSLRHLSSLTYLQIHCRNLVSLPTSLVDLSSLTYLEIQCQNLKSLPNSLGDLSSLSTLKIQWCSKLESLPDSVGNLYSLEILEISDLPVKSLPETVGKLKNLQTLYINVCPISQLVLRAWPFSSSLSNLKRLELSVTGLFNISLPVDCCPGLENLYLYNNDHLREIEFVATTVKHIKLEDCKILSNIRGIVNLVSIQKLMIKDCPELDALPSFAQSPSLQEFELRGCHRVKKIQGLEYCRALEELRADTRWEIPSIESLKRLERLRRVELRAMRKTGVESCIPTMQKWVEEVIICTQAVHEAASHLNSFTFPSVNLLDSITNQEIDWDQIPKLVQNRSPNGDAIIVCFVLNCLSAGTEFIIESQANSQVYKTVVEDGKWVWIGVFTQRSNWYTSVNYSISGSSRSEVEKGLLVRVKEERLAEAFRGLWGLLAY